MIEFVTGRYLRRDFKTDDYTRRRNEEKACGQGFDSPHLHHSNTRKGRIIYGFLLCKEYILYIKIKYCNTYCN